VDYALTPLGQSLIDPVTALAEWAQTHAGEINEARQRFDGTSSTAGAVKALLGLSRA
jgi:DNA-binding HxlR family transcriptional regulator